MKSVRELADFFYALSEEDVIVIANGRKVNYIPAIRDAKTGEKMAVDGYCFHDASIWENVGGCENSDASRILDWREDEPDVIQVHYLDHYGNYIDGICKEFEVQFGEIHLFCTNTNVNLDFTINMSFYKDITSLATFSLKVKVLCN